MIRLLLDQVIANQTRTTVSEADAASLTTWLTGLPLARGFKTNEDLMVLGYAGPVELLTQPVLRKPAGSRGPRCKRPSMKYVPPAKHTASPRS